MDIYDFVISRKAQIKEIARRHGVISLKLFGSVARHEATPASDVDFLVTTGNHLSFFFPAGMVLDLEQLLGRKVDVVTEKNLKTRLRDKILKECIDL